MELMIWVLLLLGVFAFFLTSYLAKNIFFSVIATILLIIISILAIHLGLQIQDGETSTYEDLTQTIEYTYSEIEFEGTNLSNILGVSGLLVGIYFLAAQMIKIFGGV